MDTSKEYIKMCNCEEVQAEHYSRGVRTGDYIFNGKVVEVWEIASNWVLQERDLWIPRQDQIQEMVQGSWWCSFCNISYWIEKHFPYAIDEIHPEVLLTSYEQLWLAFYMYEKHNKIWDGGKWEEE